MLASILFFGLYFLGWSLTRVLLLDYEFGRKPYLTHDERQELFWIPVIWPILALFSIKTALKGKVESRMTNKHRKAVPVERTMLDVLEENRQLQTKLFACETRIAQQMETINQLNEAVELWMDRARGTK